MSLALMHNFWVRPIVPCWTCIFWPC